MCVWGGVHSLEEGISSEGLSFIIYQGGRLAFILDLCFNHVFYFSVTLKAVK